MAVIIVTWFGAIIIPNDYPPTTQCIQVGEEEGTYNFILSEEEIVHMPRYVPYQNKTTSLMMEESVSGRNC